ncbi:unnamed protein product [Cuscuta epithymum]|uniref:Uncharacterized protein n=1 Tax=Cuscuta epithymum TaxID=186058 RepID=A0AAV0BYD0_9ASTE|nr:unnamed protein product [Cuscuta epithymum]
MVEKRQEAIGRRQTNQHRLLAIALGLAAVASPLYIDRKRKRKTGQANAADDDETIISALYLPLLLILISAAASVMVKRGVIRLSFYKKPVAIGLTLLAVLSPLYIDKDEEPVYEDQQPGSAFSSSSSSFVQPFLLASLTIAIALSGYFDRSFTRFDPYWIHRVGGSSTGILILLLLLAFVLKFKV